MKMKIYVVGSIASGKSSLAKRISEKFNITYHELDSVVHIPDKASLWGNRKRTIEERNDLFSYILQQSDWIIEDVGRPCFEEGLKQADVIILLEPSTRIRNRRIIIRWIKQKLGVEKCRYKPRYAMLKCMFQWAKDYDTGKDNLKERISPFQSKVTILNNNKEIAAFMQTYQ
jgi:adenylate kinase family enzyme